MLMLLIYNAALAHELTTDKHQWQTLARGLLGLSCPELLGKAGKGGKQAG